MRQKIVKGVLVLGIFTALLGLLGQTAAVNAADLPAEKIAIAQPLVMVPGTGATENRFDKLLAQLKKSHQDLSVVKIRVNTDATLEVSGTLTSASQHPVVVVGFQDSSDETLSQQGFWFQRALQYLQNHYQFEKYDYFGHSNGGLVVTQYLENDSLRIDPQLDHLVTLGTPYNDVGWRYNEMTTEFTAPKAVSEQLAGYLAKAHRLPQTIKMLNIVGNKDAGASDGTVPVTSVLAGRLLYGNATEYRELLITENAQHSALVQNSQVQEALVDFLWSGENSENP